MPKIIHIINNIDRGGAETLLLNIIKGCSNSDPSLEFKVLILEDKQYLRPEFESAGIVVDCIPCLHLSWFKRVSHIAKYLKREMAFVVHTHLLNSDKVGLVAGFVAGVKRRVCTIHNMEVNRGNEDKKVRLLTSIFATHLIAVSESARDFCVEHKLYPKSKISVIYNAPGFECKSIAAKTQQSDTIKIVNVARLQKQKGQIFLIRAMELLQKRGVACTLRICGEGPERNALEKEIERLRLTNVILDGLVDDIQGRLAAADLFVAPSLWEGFNMALVEGMSMGVPVVATDIPPHSEILTQEGMYDYLVKPYSAIGLADSIEEVILLSQQNYTLLSEKVLNLSKIFSMSNLITNYTQFYNGLRCL